MQSESSDNTRAFMISAFFHVLLIISAFFIVFHPPNPPLSESGNGVELNFGMDDVGSGDIQSYNPSGIGNQKELPVPGEPEKQQTPTSESNRQEVDETNDAQEEELLTTKDEKAPTVEVPKKEEKKKEIINKPNEKVKADKAIKTEIKPVINNNALFKKNAGAGGRESGKSGGGNNEGDDKSKTGNKGKPEGDLDGRAYFGKKGKGGNGESTGVGTGGSSLDMSGWTWSAKPIVNDVSDEKGKIILEIVVNEDGDLQDIKTIESTVSQGLVEVYKNAVRRTNFIQTDSRTAPPVSRGRITFIIKSN